MSMHRYIIIHLIFLLLIDILIAVLCLYCNTDGWHPRGLIMCLVPCYELPTHNLIYASWHFSEACKVVLSALISLALLTGEVLRLMLLDSAPLTLTSPGHGNIKKPDFPKCWCPKQQLLYVFSSLPSVVTVVDLSLFRALPHSFLASLRGQVPCDHLRLDADLSICAMALEADWGSWLLDFPGEADMNVVQWNVIRDFIVSVSTFPNLLAARSRPFIPGVV